MATIPRAKAANTSLGLSFRVSHIPCEAPSQPVNHLIIEALSRIILPDGTGCTGFRTRDSKNPTEVLNGNLTPRGVQRLIFLYSP